MITRFLSLRSIKARDLGMGTVSSNLPAICSEGVLNDVVKTLEATGSISLNPDMQMQNCLWF
jgi:hypothetical protein